jgi:flagellar hook-basal body complex protein FliE
MALSINTISSTLAPNAAAQLARDNIVALARTNPMHYTADGALGVGTAQNAASFQDAMLKAMDGVSGSQAKSDDLLQAVVADPDSVDAQDVTIAMAESSMSLNLAKTVLSRIVTAWKDVINTR